MNTTDGGEGGEGGGGTSGTPDSGIAGAPGGSTGQKDAGTGGGGSGGGGGETSYMKIEGYDWKYLDDGSDPGTTWHDSGFNDTAWMSGPTILGFGGDTETTTITMGALAYYFRTTFNVTNAAGIKSSVLHFRVDDGFIAYLNGVEYCRYNMPDGEATSTTVAPTALGGDVETSDRECDLVEGKSAFKDGKNEIAVEVHQWSDVSSDIALGMQFTVAR